MMKALTVVLAMGLAASACGGSDEAEEPSSTVQALEEVTTTTEAPTTTTEAPTTTTTVADVARRGEGADSSYCIASRRVDELSDAWNPLDPESTEIYFDEVTDVLEGLKPPADIAEDLEAFREGFLEFEALVAEADFNMLAIPDDSPIVNDPEMDARSDRLTAFNDFYCGPDESDGEVSGVLAELLENPDARAAFIEGFAGDSSLTAEQADCFVESLDDELFASLLALGTSGEFDPSAIDPSTISSFLQISVDCEIPLDAFG